RPVVARPRARARRDLAPDPFPRDIARDGSRGRRLSRGGPDPELRPPHPAFAGTMLGPKESEPVAATQLGDLDPRDADGVPRDRAPTIDDVRGNDGSHRALAVGCSAFVMLAVLAFWLPRGSLLR